MDTFDLRKFGIETGSIVSWKYETFYIKTIDKWFYSYRLFQN